MPAVFHQAFDDFDDLAESARAWNLDLLQLDRGPFRGDILQAFTQQTLLSHAHFGRKLLQRGAPPQGMTTIAFPATSHQRFIWRGRHIDSNCLLCFPVGAELDALSDHTFGVYTISTVDSTIDDLLAIAQQEVITLRPDRANRLRRFLKRLSETLSDEPLTQTAALDAALDVELLHELREAIASATRQPVPAIPRNAQRTVNHVIAYATEYGHQPIDMSQLTELTGLTDRSLRYAFQHVLGISPKQYLKAQRLGAVRRHLRQSEPASQSISDIAGQYGFWHRGQFAADYKRQFGELPSETIARTQTANV